MVKPNIRGIPRNQLRLGFRGWVWHSPEHQDHLIRFGYPWRRNWVDRIGNASDMVAKLDRGGQVRLIQPLIKGKQRPKRRHVISLFPFFGLFGLITAGLFFSTEFESNKKHVISPNAKQSLVTTCDEYLLHPDEVFVDWLSGKKNTQVDFQVLRRIQLGGIQSIDVRFVCAANSANFRLTLARNSGSWVMKRSVRLEN